MPAPPARQPEAVPPEAAEALRPALPRVADEIIASIAREVPEYSRAMEGEFGRVVRHGVEVALRRFLEGVRGPARETYVNLGRGELHAGRSLEALLGAYRVGARVAWRRFVEAGVAADLAPEALYRLGEAIFEYIDELSAESAEGYAAEQMAEAGEGRRRRSRLVGLLVAEPPADEEEVRAAARDARWELPRRLAALVADPEGAPLEEFAERLGRDLGLGTLAVGLDGDACALVPDPEAPGRERHLRSVVGGRAAGLGPAVDWRSAALSVGRAAAARRLAAEAPAGQRSLVVAGDHLPELLLRADPALAADLAQRLLAPLDAVAPGPRARLLETLGAWLDRPGQVQAVAAVLEVHPQTVRYRVRRLRELFGGDLDDPEGRFRLALALRARRGRPPGA